MVTSEIIRHENVSVLLRLRQINIDGMLSFWEIQFVVWRSVYDKLVPESE